MMRTVSIQATPEDWADEVQRKQILRKAAGYKNGAPIYYVIQRQSIDARSRQRGPLITATVAVCESAPEETPFDPGLQDVSKGQPVAIIGAGPAGLFAALRLIRLGLRPIIIERGKEVRARRRDLAAMNKEGIVNPDSNYCFGEGGAGTYSDGKLYTRSGKRGSISSVLELFVHFGAPEQILYQAHPHIGTNKLPHIITAMSRAIEDCGGEILFDTALTGLEIKGGKLQALQLSTGERLEVSQAILATGHSARDVFELLHRQGLALEAKPFALGVRIEHPQALIDSIQYHCEVRSPYLPPSAYSLVSQAGGRGVFSFCMCPGGIIAPAATAPGEVVVNGWSPSKRNNPFANSGIVAEVSPKDFAEHGFEGALAGVEYQWMVEQKAFAAGGGDLVAPAQRLVDFVEGKLSRDLPSCSYLPGIKSTRMEEVLPPEVSNSLRLALKDFGKKMKGYLTNEAVVVATESRTSSPVRIPRDAFSLQHPQVQGLYPCGEGAGYAGGIVSAAIDGERCAEAVAGELKIK